jgi:hypothetical protein
MPPRRNRVQEVWPTQYGPGRDLGRVRASRLRAADLTRHRPIPPRTIGSPAQSGRPCRLDVQHRAHTLHARLSRRQLATAQRHDARGKPLRPSPPRRGLHSGAGYTFTVLNPGDNDVIGCVYLYPSPSEEWDVKVQSWVRADRSSLDLPLADAVARWLATDWPWERLDRCGR